MSSRLTGKKAFVTAAGAGIGRATALAFAHAGAQVVATDRDPALLKALTDADPTHTLHAEVLDVLQPEAIAAAAARHGPIDVLFNCAGFVHHGSVLDCTEEEWAFAFDLNVRSMFRTIKAFAPGMMAKGGGSIINIASAASSIKGAPNRFVYGATKAAVIGLTKSVAADFIAKGVRCNAICPGTVESPSLRERIAALAKTNQITVEQAEAMFISRQPMGRLGTAEEIASLAVYLASDDAAFTTGTTQLIDGGWTL
jgi:2-keto-3-deoxy-L-fuconate dehydrogenase